MSNHILKEAILVDIIKNYLNQLNLSSKIYKNIKIINLGNQNYTDGPDFLNAEVQFDDRTERGDIEIHLISSSWYTHNHHSDAKYKNTILNICLTDDSQEGYNIYSNDKIIPIVYVDSDIFSQLLKTETNRQNGNKNNISAGFCQNFHKDNIPLEYLQKFGMERFNTKLKKFKNLIAKEGLEEAFYISILEALGYIHNTRGFIKLAITLNISTLKKLTNKKAIKNSDDIYQQYLQTIDTITKNESVKLWNTKSIYPKGNPLLRLKIISPFILYLATDKIETILKNFFSLYSVGKLEKFLGKYIKSTFLIRNLTFNVILPFLKIFIKDCTNNHIQEYKTLPLNYLTRYAVQRMFSKDRKIRLAREIYQQGLIYLSKNYCSFGLKGCEWCPLYLEYTG